jgi:hypothetical protein
MLHCNPALCGRGDPTGSPDEPISEAGGSGRRRGGRQARLEPWSERRRGREHPVFAARAATAAARRSADALEMRPATEIFLSYLTGLRPVGEPIEPRLSWAMADPGYRQKALNAL